jgi:predicted ATPase
MDLLEREPHLERLHSALSEARAGAGRLCLVTGEAGIGKTAVVDGFAAAVTSADASARVLRGSCDALFTPRPVGPLLDMANAWAPFRTCWNRPPRPTQRQAERRRR